MIDKLWYLVNNNLVEAIELKQGKTKYKRDLNKTFKYSKYNREKKRYQRKRRKKQNSNLWSSTCTRGFFWW